MIHLDRDVYPYLEEINDGALAQFPSVPAGGGKPRVLDVGCGQGQLGEAIRARGYEVWGIESAPPAVARAAARLDRVVAGDLLDPSAVAAALGSERFDHLLFSDVLEHTYHPLQVLKEYLPYLVPGGTVVVSLPNVGAWEFRLRHLLGFFDYADTGVMDRTHLRFFTFRTAKSLLRAAGLTVVRVDQTPYLVRAALPLLKRLKGGGGGEKVADPRAIIDSKAYRFYQRFVYPAERRVAGLWKGLLAFRIILVAAKPGGPAGIQGRSA